MLFNIMFVDGSACVHEAVKWLLKDDPYQLIVFKDPWEALRAIEEEKFAVVIAEQWLHEMSGIDFLKKTKERSPNTMGIIMTSFVETEAAIDAIRHGYVSHFLKKPLDKAKVKKALEMAISSYEIEVVSQILRPLNRVPQH